MRFSPPNSLGWFWRIGLFLVLSLGYFWFYQNGAIVNFYLATKTSSKFTVYWADEGERFSQTRSNTVRIYPKVNHYSMRIGDLGHIKKLRIDPLERRGKIQLRSFKIRQQGYKNIVYQHPDDLRQFIPRGHVKEKWVNELGLWMISSGIDPNLHLDIEPDTIPGESKYNFSVYVFFLLLSLLPYHRFLRSNYEFVPYLMLFVSVLIFIMASISRYNKHPDEYVHYQAAKYFEYHLTPPPICTPGTEKTYSIYGMSRLNSYEMAYLFAGKFSGILGFLPIENYRRVRYFNVTLWFLLTLLAMYSVRCRPLFIPLLVSPQIWYLFSYANSDAFALFLLFIISYLIIDEQTMLNTYLNKSEIGLKQILRGTTLGILLGMLLLLKLNYYFFVVFLILWGTAALIRQKMIPVKKYSRKVALLAVTALLVIGVRAGWDLWINGFEKPAKILECREKLAKKAYKPSTPIENKAGILAMRQRGIGLKEFIFNLNYLSILFRSGTGVYGYMEMAAQEFYYRFMMVFITLFIGIGIFVGYYKTPLDLKVLSAIVLCCGISIVLAAAWKSWTSVFQPQGRYIFPILPMIGILYYQLKDRTPKHFLSLVFAGLFLGSVYSFIWIGIVNIPTI